MCARSQKFRSLFSCRELCTCTHEPQRSVTDGRRCVRPHRHPLRRARPRLRMRLQPRAVGSQRLARRRAAHAAGRHRTRGDQHLRLVVDQPRSGGLGFQRTRRDHRAAARGGDPHQSRHRHRVSCSLAHRPPPRDPPGRRRRHGLPPGRSSGLLPEFPALPGLRRRGRHPRRRALREPPRRVALACVERTGLPQRALLLRHERRGVPRLAARPLRRHRSAQPRLGHDVLEPALLRLRRRARAGAGPVAAQPRPDPRLPAVQLRRAARALPRRGRDPARAQRGAGHDQLHGHRAHPQPRLLDVGGRDGSDRQRPLSRPPPRRCTRRTLVRRRPHPRPRAGRAVAADGDLDRRRELAALQPRQGPG